MKLWKNNRLDSEYEMSEEDIARGFLASSYAEIPWPLDRKLRLFMASKDGLSSVWVDDDAYNTVAELVIQLRDGGEY